MTDGWLAEAKRPGQVADTCLAIGLCLDQTQQPQAGGIGDRPQRSCQLIGFSLIEWSPSSGGHEEVVMTSTSFTPPYSHRLILTAIDAACDHAISIRHYRPSSPGSSREKRSPATSPSQATCSATASSASSCPSWHTASRASADPVHRDRHRQAGPRRLVTVERRHRWAYYSVPANSLKELSTWLS